MGLGKAQFPTCMRKLLTVESATNTQNQETRLDGAGLI